MSNLNETASNALPLLQAKINELGFDVKVKWVEGDNKYWDSLDLVLDIPDVYQYNIQSVYRKTTEVALDVEAFLSALSGIGFTIPDSLIKTLKIDQRIELKQCVLMSLTEGCHTLDTAMWYPVASLFDDNAIEIKGDFEKSWISVDNNMNYIVRPIKPITFTIIAEVKKGYEGYQVDDYMEYEYYFQENPEAKEEELNYTEKTVKVIQYE